MSDGVDDVSQDGTSESVAAGAVMSSQGGAEATKPPRIEHAGNGGGGALTPVRTSEAARALVRRRWDAMSRAARLGLSDAGDELPVISKKSPLAVIQYLVEQHAKHAAHPDKRGAAASFRQVVELAYPKPDKADSGAPAASAVDSDMQQLLTLFRAWRTANPERAAALLAQTDDG